MWWERRIFGLLCLLLLSSGLPASHSTAELVDRIIAYVNDDIITLSELNEKTQTFMAIREQNPFLRDQSQSLETVRRNILDSLINERLTAQEISRLQISVSDLEVDQVIAKVLSENRLTQEALEAQLRKEGKTIADLRQQIRRTLEQNQLINREVRSKTVITDELVEAYYQSHLDEFIKKERWRLQDIFLPFPPAGSAADRARLYDLAKQIRDRLAQGDDFALLAQRFSRGPGAEQGGDLGFFSKGELDPALEKAIAELKEGESSPVIETKMGLHIIKVTEVDMTPPRPLEEVRESIYNQLFQRELDYKYREWISSLRERSFVKIEY